MIAGETELLVGNHLKDEGYDDFLFGSKEKRAKRRAARRARRANRRSDPKRIARKAKRKQFFSRLGQAYQDIGGGAAIGGAIDTIISNPRPEPAMGGTSMQETDMPSDFQVGIKDSSTKASGQNSNTLWIVGGVVVVGGIVALAVYQSRKKNYIRVTQE